MYQYEQSSGPSLLNLVLTAGVFIVAAVYGMLSLTTEDMLWFWPYFDETPQDVVVHCYGTDLVFLPGDPHFEALTGFINDGLSSHKNWDTLTMSEVSYQEYQTRTDFMTLEAHYRTPVRIHSIYKFFGGVDTLVIPLYGRHASSNAVFGRTNGVNSAGSLHIDSLAGFQDYLSGQGLCTEQ